MSPAHGIAVLTLTALLAGFTGPVFGAAAGKGGSSHRGKASEHMSGKGRVNTNAQWSADPDRGWIRAEERHKLHEKDGSSDRVKPNDGQQKGKRKPRKF